jgi:arabinofuranosyltransferase
MIRSLNGPMTRIERFGLALGLALSLLLMWPLRHYVTDDTYIHLQYARHLAHGQGLVFNTGERVYGCTSPLWVTLIADGMALGFDGLTVAKLIGALSTLASVGLFLQLMRRTLRSPGVRAAATVAWSCHAWMLRWSLSGMETPLAVALVLAGFVAFTEGRQWGSHPVRTGALWALAAMTRPEAVFLLILWGIFLVIDTDSRPGLRRLLFGALPPVIIYGGWLVFARTYFGTFWPQTLTAKAAEAQDLGAQLDNLVQQLRIVGATDGVMAALLVASLVFGFRRMWPAHLRAQRLLPWVWVVAVPALYMARGVPVLSRYLLPLLPVLAWLAWRTAELWWVGEIVDEHRLRRAGALAMAVAMLSIALNVGVYRAKVVPHVRDMAETMRGSLVHWGAWLRDNTPADALVAVPDIGAVGYVSGRRVLDTAGLVTPEMVPMLTYATRTGVDPRDTAVEQLAFASFARPGWLLERGPTPGELLRRSPYAAALVPVGSTVAPSLGISRGGRTVYTLYRVRWEAYDSLRVRR